MDFFFNLQLGREVLDIAANATEVGITTEEIDRIVHEVNVFHQISQYSLTDI